MWSFHRSSALAGMGWSQNLALHFSFELWATCSLCSLRYWGDQPGVSEEGIRSVWRLEGQLRWVKSSVAYHLLYLGRWIWRYVCHRLFVLGQFSVASISAGVARDAAKRIGRASQRPSASRNPLNCTCQHVWRVWHSSAEVSHCCRTGICLVVILLATSPRNLQGGCRQFLWVYPCLNSALMSKGVV